MMFALQIVQAPEVKIESHWECTNQVLKKTTEIQLLHDICRDILAGSKHCLFPSLSKALGIHWMLFCWYNYSYTQNKGNNMTAWKSKATSVLQNSQKYTSNLQVSIQLSEMPPPQEIVLVDSLTCIACTWLCLVVAWHKQPCPDPPH